MLKVRVNTRVSLLNRTRNSYHCISDSLAFWGDRLPGEVLMGIRIIAWQVTAGAARKILLRSQKMPEIRSV